MPPRGGPCAAERRSLCRRVETLCAGRSSVLRGLEEAPVSGGGPCASRGGPLCLEVPCAERIEGGPCVGKRLTVPNGSTPLC